MTGAEDRTDKVRTLEPDRVRAVTISGASLEMRTPQQSWRLHSAQLN